jgi:hypothetical protein
MPLACQVKQPMAIHERPFRFDAPGRTEYKVAKALAKEASVMDYDELV